MGVGVDDVQAAYWSGGITRAEAQKTFDEFARTIRTLVVELHGTTETTPPQNGLIVQLTNLSLSVAFLMNVLKVDPKEFQEFVRARMTEITAAAKKQMLETGASQEKPRVSLASGQ